MINYNDIKNKIQTDIVHFGRKILIIDTEF